MGVYYTYDELWLLSPKGYLWHHHLFHTKTGRVHLWQSSSIRVLDMLMLVGPITSQRRQDNNECVQFNLNNQQASAWSPKKVSWTSAEWWVHFYMATKNIVMKFLWWNEDEMETSNGASYWRDPKPASNCTLRQGGQGNNSLILTSDVTQCGRQLRDKTKKTAIYAKYQCQVNRLAGSL